MRVSKVLFAASYSFSCITAAPKAFDQGPQTFDELRLALHELGIPGVHNVEAPPKSVLDSRALGTSSHLCAATCSLLGAFLGGITSLPGSLPYITEQKAYWSDQQGETSPACRSSPKNAVEVAATLLISEFLHCPFAVKSGGHAAFAGASNIQGGITIDLINLRTVKISADKTVTQVGAGNKWLDVYSKLDAFKLSVVGGRVSGIGVGGLTLGGGISFFSGRHGWACDGVRNYQVVLASGEICEVNEKSKPDLYFALRGGGNNFGIVTRFDLETFPQGNLWGGMTVYPITANVSIYKAFENFANNAPKDPDAALITAVALVQGQLIFSNDYEYAKPVVNPPIFHEFTSIPNITSTMRIDSLSNLTLELNASNPDGFRETYTTITFKVNSALQTKILGEFVKEMNPIMGAKGFLPALVMQPITKDMATYFTKRGGNPLGISVDDCPLVLMNLAIMWSDKKDDNRIIDAASRVIQYADKTSHDAGLGYKYVYQNYASLNQSVFASYGKENQNRLIQISKKYDPRQIFQNLQPGYFKLDGGNGGSPS